MSSNLFKEFLPVTAKAWKQKIQVDLKGTDYNETLLWLTDDGITVKPFYTKEDANNIPINLPRKGFSICQSICVNDEKTANTLAITALKRGAIAIEFVIQKKINYTLLLENLTSKNTLFYFNFGFLDTNFILELSKYINSKKSFFNIDIIGNLAKTGNWFFNEKEDYQQIKKITQNTTHPIAIQASLYQNAGANSTQQIAYALAHANEYLHYFGSQIASKIHFNFAVGNHYFFEIAKLRAFRILWDLLLQEYQTTNTAHIFAQPSLRNKTLYDYNVNMLRTTSECMSAILGGANTISNISYDKLYHKPNEFGERIARNQLLILQQESELFKAQDIANGTYYIESITEQLATKALAVFKSIEKSGGFLKQLKEGIIQKKIKETAHKEQTKFDTKKLILVGTNKNQNKEDTMKNELELYPFVKIKNKKTYIEPILEKRLSENLEKERLNHE